MVKQTYRRQKRGKTGQSTAQKALALAKKANKTELKYLDTDENPLLVPNVHPAGNYLWSTCNELLQGTANNRRVGNVVTGTSIQIKARGAYNPLALSGGQLYRIIVYQNLNSGINSATTDYLQSTSFYSHKSIDNRFNSVTLYDKVFQVTLDRPQQMHNISLKLKKPMISYGNSSAAPEKNNVQVLVITNEPTQLNSPFIQGQLRFYFTDK